MLLQTPLLLQADLETRMGAIAALHARSKDVQVVLLCDRGVLDGKAFCETEEEWQMILNAAETTEGAILQRYDMVCHLVTAAKGAAEHYEYGATSRNPSAHCSYIGMPGTAVATENCAATLSGSRVRFCRRIMKTHRPPAVTAKQGNRIHAHVIR